MNDQVGDPINSQKDANPFGMASNLAPKKEDVKTTGLTKSVMGFDNFNISDAKTPEKK